MIRRRAIGRAQMKPLCEAERRDSRRRGRIDGRTARRPRAGRIVTRACPGACADGGERLHAEIRSRGSAGGWGSRHWWRHRRSSTRSCGYLIRIAVQNRRFLPCGLSAPARAYTTVKNMVINDVPRRDAREFRPGPRSSLFCCFLRIVRRDVISVALANYTPPYGSGRVDTTVDGRTSTVVPGTDCTLSRVTTREHDRSALRAVRIEYFAMQRSHVDRRVVNVHACKRPIFDASLERKPKPR